LVRPQPLFFRFKFSYLQVEAFKVTPPKPDNKFDTSEVCPRDQHATDMVPVIVGSCLAGLIVITMVTYLIYRCQLPTEVLQLTNTPSNPSDAGSTDHSNITSTNNNIRSHSIKD
ncbi:hypothetical protein COOONC_10521, partial [Cooperia oncophora]